MEASLTLPWLLLAACFQLIKDIFFNPSISVFKSVNNQGGVNLTSDEVKGIKCIKLASLKAFFFPRLTLWGIRCVQFIYRQKNIKGMDKLPDAVVGKEIGCCWKLTILLK